MWSRRQADTREEPDTVTPMTETSRELSAMSRRLLLRRGLRLEYATLAWNVVGSVLVLFAAGGRPPIQKLNARAFKNRQASALR